MNRSNLASLVAVSAVFLLSLSATAEERTLFRFDAGFDLKTIAARDARVSAVSVDDGFALRISTGHAERWPGVTLKAPTGAWDLSPYAAVSLEVKNLDAAPVTVSCRVDNPGADGTNHCVSGSVKLEPGQTGLLTVPLRRSSGGKLDGKLFGMRGYPVETGGPHTVDVGKITQILIFVGQPTADANFTVDHLCATGSYTPPTASLSDADPYLPFLDTFGQYRHKDWPGKVKSPADLLARREAEAKELAAHPGPAGWDPYGGFADGPQLESTGFFRVQKHEGKWWLVDPDGHLFFSHGVDCVRMLDTTSIEGREEWFENFPGLQPEFSEFFSKSFSLKGHYAGRSPRCFSFAGANVKRKYGPDWKSAYAEIAHRRLRSWGLNTIANWSDSDVFLLRRTPYTDSISSHGAKRIEGSEGYWGKFPDVFDPSFADSVLRAAEEKRGSSAGDPWCLGYFSDNEMSWGDEVSFGLAALLSPADQPAKREFVAHLEAHYVEIAKLNAAWGTTHDSWAALRDSREVPDKIRARADLTAFYTKTADRYFQTVREAIRSVAPHHLYLGCRFSAVNDYAAQSAARFCDVVSYNLYRRSVADFRFPGGDKPLLIGEFHFGALDRGMFHTGLVPVQNQAARADAYKDYVLGALRHPQFVGTHWFQWKDEPTSGRVYDEENYQIGFLDVADTPYRETIEATREVGRLLYRMP